MKLEIGNSFSVLRVYLISLKSMQWSASKSVVMKEAVTKGKFLEWGSVKTINKQMMYRAWFCSSTKFHQLVTVPWQFNTWSTLSLGNVSGKHLQMRFALSRGRTCFRSLTRDFLLIKPYGNKKHFINKTKKLSGHELKESFFRQALAFHWKSCWVRFHTVFCFICLLYLNKWLQLGGQRDESLLIYQGMNGIKIQMFLILTVGNNMVPQ